MKRDKHVGMDVHQSMTVVAVMNAEGKIVLESMVPTAASRIRELIESLSGPLHVTLEEGSQAEWLYEVIRDLVKEVVVCDPKRNKLLSEESKGDKPDARRLAELLRVGMVRSVWHGHARTGGLKQMVRAYETFTIDTKRTMLRIKAIYRSRGIPTGGSGVYQVTQREQWLGQIPEAGIRQRAAWLYEQLDQVRKLRKQAKAGMLAESRHHRAITLLRSIPPVAVVFGNAEATDRALRVTFDGWMAKVGPAAGIERLQEREYCSLSGILAASLAISELFLQCAEVSIAAGRRTFALSLWRPELPISDPEALGVPVQFLPRQLWTLGLGHLGNAYLWSLATLPYLDPGEVEIFLNDYDKIEGDNVETSLLLSEGDIGKYKTRACAAWLKKRGFETRLVERPFDSNFRRRDDEPGVALCGFDSNPARRDLAGAQFLRIVESGLGETANNFDTISLHTLPNPRPAVELWPDLPPDEDSRRREHQERMARENNAYLHINHDECGRFQLAGKSIAVPFVGAAAAALVVAETIRLFHRGPVYTDIKLALGALDTLAARTSGSYSDHDTAGLRYSTTRAM